MRGRIPLFVLALAAGCSSDADQYQCAGAGCGTPVPLKTGNWVSAPLPAGTPRTWPHVGGTERTATIDAGATKVTIRYQKDGHEIVETWAVAQGWP